MVSATEPDQPRFAWRVMPGMRRLLFCFVALVWAGRGFAALGPIEVHQVIAPAALGDEKVVALNKGAATRGAEDAKTGGADAKGVSPDELAMDDILGPAEAEPGRAEGRFQRGCRLHGRADLP